MSEDLSPLELLRQENELLRNTINSADKDIEELEAQLQVIKILKRDSGRKALACFTGVDANKLRCKVLHTAI